MRKPIHSDAEIIKTGKMLATQRGGEISAWDIHKELGGRGKLSRIRDLWEEHAARREEVKLEAVVLPDDVQVQLSDAMAAFGQSIEGIISGVISRMTEQNIRQFAIRDRDFLLLEAEHATKVRRLEEEITYLTERLEELEEEDEVTETVDPEPARPAPAEPVPAAVAPVAARKSPNRPVRKTPAPRKAARPAPRAPKPSRAQTQPLS